MRCHCICLHRTSLSTWLFYARKYDVHDLCKSQIGASARMSLKVILHSLNWPELALLYASRVRTFRTWNWNMYMVWRDLMSRVYRVTISPNEFHTYLKLHRDMHVHVESCTVCSTHKQRYSKCPQTEFFAIHSNLFHFDWIVLIRFVLWSSHVELGCSGADPISLLSDILIEILRLGTDVSPRGVTTCVLCARLNVCGQ